MTEADLWPSASLEYDTLAPFPRSIALPLTNLNGGAKLQNLNTPSTPRVLQHTKERSITTGELSRPTLLKLRSFATKASELHALDAAQTPEEPPSQPILPKPPYRIRSKATKGVGYQRRSMHSRRVATSQTNDRAIDLDAAFPIIRTKQRQIMVTMDTGKWFRAQDTVRSCLQHTRHPAPDLIGRSILFWQPGPACMPFDRIPAQTNFLTSEVNISTATAQW